MASKLRTPALVIALIAAVLIIFVEIGGSFQASMSLFEGLGSRITDLRDSFSNLVSAKSQDRSLKPGLPKPGLPKRDIPKPKLSKPELSKPEFSKPKFSMPKGLKIPTDFKQIENMMGGGTEKSPGLAAAALIHIDVLLLTTLLLFNLPLIISARLIAKIQGCVSCVMGLATAFLGIITILKALVSLFLMVGLLMAIPFGTLVYFARYAAFDTTKAAALIGTLMFLKVVLVVCLIIAHERFLLNFGLIALVGTSFIAMIIVTFLHSFPPTFLVSITDGVAAIIVSVLAIIWAIVYLIGGVIGILSMIKGTIL